MDKPQQIGDGIVRLGSTKVNWYLVADEEGVTVVDAGVQGFLPQLDSGLKLLGRSREDLRAFILTHGDADHVGVAAKLQDEGDRTPIHLHPADRYLVQGKNKKTDDSLVLTMLRPGAWTLMAHFARNGALRQPKIERTADLSDGQTLDLPGRPQVIHTPGHTEGHVVFHFPQHGALFVGDTICTWHPISGRRGPQLMAFNVSNRTALDSLSAYEDIDAQLLLVGHGEPWNQAPAKAVELARADAAGLRPVSV
jgi:glyoxylase-like metal-dependent hydrolase (beta-lactamase superfamily II)